MLNKFYSFTNPFGTQWTIWYLRESYTALLCANLPLVYPLFQYVFKLRNWNSGNRDAQSEHRTRRPTTPKHPSWDTSRPTPAHKGLRGVVRRTESQEIMGYSFDDEMGDLPQFVTSAIDMDDLSSPVKSSCDRSEEGRKEGSNHYHPV